MAGLVRRLALVEPLCFFLLLMAYIWLWRFRHPHGWIALLAYLLVSHAIHREGPRELGFGRRSLRECVHVFAPLFAILALFLIAGGLLLHTTRAQREGWLTAALERELSAGERAVVADAVALLGRVADV